MKTKFISSVIFIGVTFHRRLLNKKNMRRVAAILIHDRTLKQLLITTD